MRLVAKFFQFFNKISMKYSDNWQHCYKCNVETQTWYCNKKVKDWVSIAFHIPKKVYTVFITLNVWYSSVHNMNFIRLNV